MFFALFSPPDWLIQGEVLGLRENDKTSLLTELMNTTDYLLLAGSKMISGWVNGKINDLVIL